MDQDRVDGIDESEIEQFLIDWELEIRAGYTPAAEILDQLPERAGDFFPQQPPAVEDALLARLLEHTHRVIASEQAAEQTWDELTHNDRISAAFDDLRKAGVVAIECAGLTIQDGWGRVGLQASRSARGAVFFHQQDVIDAVDGMGLLLAFGSFEEDPAREEQKSTAVALEVIGALESHGVATSWSAKVSQRLEVRPFEWKKRRWTTPQRKSRPPRPFWQQIWGRSPKISLAERSRFPDSFATRYEPSPEETQVSLARQLTQDVVAQRTTYGFDKLLASDIRKAWAAFGDGQRGQVCHLGTPHVFLPAGDVTTMGPIDALKNLRAEVVEIRSRAARLRVTL